jgi:hypothetical protein
MSLHSVAGNIANCSEDNQNKILVTLRDNAFS